MIYTFKSLRDVVLHAIDEYNATDEHTLALVKEFMNEAEERRCAEYRWPFLKYVGSISTVAGVADYALHPEYDRPIKFETPTTTLVEVPDRQVVMDSYVEAEGQAKFFQIRETWPVALQPPTPSALTLSSDNVSDTTLAYGIAIKGEDEDGIVRAEVLTPNGTTPVTGNVVFRKVLSVTKAQAWNGNLTLKAGATVLLTLLPWEMGKQHRVLHLFETPLTGETITYSFYRTPLPMVNDYDVPTIPAPYCKVLVWDTLLALRPYLQSIPPDAVEEWRALQRQWEREMLVSLMEGQSLAAEPRRVRDMGDGY